jgi:hypothetical protein
MKVRMNGSKPDVSDDEEVAMAASGWNEYFESDNDDPLIVQEQQVAKVADSIEDDVGGDDGEEEGSEAAGDGESESGKEDDVAGQEQDVKMTGSKEDGEDAEVSDGANDEGVETRPADEELRSDQEGDFRDKEAG